MKNIFLNVKMPLFLLYLFSLDEKLLPPLKTNTYGTRKASLSLVFFFQEKKREMYVTGTCHVTIIKSS